MTRLPFVLHDLQDSQIYALAQAAGRAGFEVVGTTNPEEPWVRRSKYVREAYAMPCLSDLTASMYAYYLKQTGLSGVWLPCTDDLAEFTARYRGFLEKMGMRFLAPAPEAVARVFAKEFPEVEGLVRPWGGEVRVASLYEEASKLPYPLILKAVRGHYRLIRDPEALVRVLDALQAREHPEETLAIEAYVPGEVPRMASAIVLCDGEGRAVRGFTARRLRAAKAGDGLFGETTAARAEWIPELWEAAASLMEALGWRGFAEVECKQGLDGRWYLLEVNPRISGWGVLAEADGAGLLAAYHALCAEGARLEPAVLQRSRARYVRVIATVYHDPDWAVPTEPQDSLMRRARRLAQAVWAKLRDPAWVSLGAWDAWDLKASLWLLGRTIRRVWALFRGRTRLD